MIERLEMTEIPFAEILGEAPVGVIVLSDRLVYRYANAYALRFMALPPAEVVDRPLLEVLPKLGYRDPHAIFAACKAVLDTGRPIHHEAWPHPARTGLPERWTDWTLRRFATPTGVVGLVLSLADVTAHVQAREQARQAEAARHVEQARLALVLEQLPAGVTIAEAPSGRLLFHNQEAERLHRHPLVGAVISKEDYGHYGAVHPDGRPYRHDEYPIARALLGESIHQHEMRYQRGDGTTTVLSVSAAPVIVDGRLDAAVSTCFDIAESKRLEQALREANHELESFAYVASHDLQEPLRMVTSYLGLLARKYRGHLDRQAIGYIEEAVGGAERMQRLIRHLLDFARIDRTEPRLAPVDSGRALDDALRALVARTGETGAIVTRGELPVVRADGEQLARLFQNLVGNALKYTPPDRAPAVRVEAEAEGAELVFSVRDNGIGIAPEDHQRIFALFQRLHGRDEYPGTGIGLAICKKVVERHGGRIWVESSPGAGANFRFALPR